MTTKNLLTSNAKVAQIEQAYYAPVSVVSGQDRVINTTYCFLSRIIPWENETIPELPAQTQKYLKSVFKNIFTIKKITSSDISPVIHRVDWTEDTIYDRYSDEVDMLAKDVNGFNIYNFYVKNKFDQVFKCLWNNNGTPSVNEPYFQPGTYGTNKIYKGDDGYKWKFIYSIDSGIKYKFMDKHWMPIPIGKNIPNPLNTALGGGGIEVVNVLTGGTGYDSTSPINLKIIGDGTGATISAIMDNESFSDIIVTSPGKNYTYASVALVYDNPGSSATFDAPTSPIGGHGFDPISELGCANIMYTVEFDGSEGDIIPTDIDYRQIGLLVNPITLSSTPHTADGAIYRISTDFVVSSGFGVYALDELIYQGTYENPTFTANMLSFNTSSNVVKLINTTGTPVVNAPVFGYSSGTVRTLLNISYPDFIPQSGYITYIENRPGIQRSDDGIEQLKFVLEY
jgi:hypothetical protein